ncbi:hypothetical protein [Anaerobranca gottschalkii]|uniref:Uncharacterized protein n=1 Tax=Anaerobranca gottschalkii DSM 13577 TaxID=1120990 RepID=A0A1H9YYA4_9FIRM|nr:hypothetical protein [Anaerobranca gottschalkii]SES74077.1 hypothetical protein SAMN03080614_100590 [Anaerobranca gottschalkii DSM 13577]
MGRRRKRGGNGRKILGILFALIGVYILVSTLPIYVWWIVIGLVFIIVGWLLFNA